MTKPKLTGILSGQGNRRIHRKDAFRPDVKLALIVKAAQFVGSGDFTRRVLTHGFNSNRLCLADAVRRFKQHIA